MSDVRAYYDANTWMFVVLGSGEAIHRELYAPGIASRRAALELAHELVHAELERVAGGGGRALDLGCGVGAACRFLAGRGAEVDGVSISPRQIEAARRLTARAGLTDRCRYREADFCALPADLTGFDLAYAIEAFVHAPAADRFFAGAAAALRPGGRLALIDDFRTAAAAEPILAVAEAGWHLHNLVEPARAIAVAARHGLRLVTDRDLSPYQRLGRPRDRLIRGLLPVLRRAAPRSRWCQSLVGGDALQACHRRGLLEYRLLVFERAPAGSAGPPS